MKRAIILLVLGLNLSSCKNDKNKLTAMTTLNKKDHCLNLCNKIQITIENKTDTDYYFSRPFLDCIYISRNDTDITNEFISNELKKFESNIKFKIDSTNNKVIMYDGSYKIIEDSTIYPWFFNKKEYALLISKINEEEVSFLIKLNNVDTIPKELKYIPNTLYSNITFLPHNKTIVFETDINSIYQTKGVYKISFNYNVTYADTIGYIDMANGSKSYRALSNQRKVILNKYYRFNGNLKSNTIKIKI